MPIVPRPREPSGPTHCAGTDVSTAEDSPRCRTASKEKGTPAPSQGRGSFHSFLLGADPLDAYSGKSVWVAANADVLPVAYTAFDKVLTAGAV